MKVCVVGLGYIGFPTACVVARAGHEVLGVDVDSTLIHRLSNGDLHLINEDGLADIARDAFLSGKLRVSQRPETADVFVIAVPTPCRKVAGTQGVSPTEGELAGALSAAHAGPMSTDEAVVRRGADLTYVRQATHGIAPFIRAGNLVILESTVPPGTTNGFVRGILEERVGLVCGEDMLLAHAPERVLPGQILREMIDNDRIVGGVNDKSTDCAVAFYRTFVNGQVFGTDATTAELVKLMENTFRDVNIALANEFALICEQLGLDVFEAIALANRHPRVNVLKPGPGVGGHCIAVDPYFIIEAVPDKARLVSVARQVNSSMPRHVLDLVMDLTRDVLESGVRVQRVTALGASYKPNIGDERESPALQVALLLAKEGYEVTIHDPYVARFSRTDLLQSLRGSDLLVMLTDHEVYRDQLEPRAVARQMRHPFIVDTRGFFGYEWDKAGFTVIRLGVGRGRRERTSR
jgi:UDP-N-acetyl-D-mannosaminuronic acid dehydrogenase